MKEISNNQEISNHMNNAEHLGTNFLEGLGCMVKTKTFNLYKTTDNKYLVTNHYGTELINARLYENLEELHKDYPEERWRWEKYSYPLLP